MPYDSPEQPQQPQKPQRKPALPPGVDPNDPNVDGGEMASLWSAVAQHLRQSDALAPQREQLKEGAVFGRHLGTGGAPITPDNPTGNAANPWAANGLFHGGFGSQVQDKNNPLLDSQGGSAINQLRKPGEFGWSAAPTMSAEEGAVRASPAPFHISNQDRERVGLPPRVPNLNDYYGMSDPMAGYARPTNPVPPHFTPGAPTLPPTNASPRPGSAFGWPNPPTQLPR